MGQGYKEGLERGRMVAIEAVRAAGREEEYQRRINQEDEQERENKLARYRGIRGEGETIRVRQPIPPISMYVAIFVFLTLIPKLYTDRAIQSQYPFLT